MTSQSPETLSSKDYLTLLRPALPHLVRLEAYFRINGLEDLSADLDRALSRAEQLLAERSSRSTRGFDGSPGGGNGGVPPSDDPDQSPYNAASTPGTHGRAILG